MSRYIDADLLMQKWLFRGKSQAMYRDEIRSVPTADVVEVVHGEWVFNQFGEPHCSVCGNYPLQNGDESYALSNYCPNCGADMRGGDAK